MMVSRSGKARDVVDLEILRESGLEMRDLGAHELRELEGFFPAEAAAGTRVVEAAARLQGCWADRCDTDHASSTAEWRGQPCESAGENNLATRMRDPR